MPCDAPAESQACARKRAKRVAGFFSITHKWARTSGRPLPGAPLPMGHRSAVAEGRETSTEPRCGCPSSLGAEIVIGDVTDAAALADALQGCSRVAHFAGLLASRTYGWSEYLRVNVEATEQLARLSAVEGVDRFLFTSSVWACGFRHTGSIDESTPLEVVEEPYGESKRQAQLKVLEVVHDLGLPAVIVQPAPVYGPYDRAWTLALLRLLRKGMLARPGGGRGRVQPIFVDGMAVGCVAALDRGRVGEVYLLCGPEDMAVGEFFTRFAKVLGRSFVPPLPRAAAIGSAKVMEAWARRTGGDPAYTCESIRGMCMDCIYNDGKARRELGFDPQTSIEAGMQAVEAWFKQERPL
jgi:dihydroflavonol-4-reductase